MLPKQCHSFRCSAERGMYIIVKEKTCNFHQHHPVAHRGINKDFIDQDLLPNVIHACTIYFTSAEAQNIYDIETNFGLMKAFYVTIGYNARPRRQKVFLNESVFEI